ncbi:cytochrome P450 [Catellatospora sp. KI3]|uniref:cytochrome P450 n=1 Tax=Catellatospora sp. KI3 TaxID=3041620 RepID=UPI002482BEE4|nr:cytochrome P450 [Catellatospora sp. KI3]MDI1463962.1 cytochrome P450 [Catellatospora sp. KI3]
MTGGISLQPLRSAQGRANPYPFYAHLHTLGGLALVGGADERYDVVVHGYDAVQQVLRSPDFLTVDARHLDRSMPQWREHPSLTTLRASMFFTNAPDHTRIRRQFGHAFTARRLHGLGPAITRMTDDLIDRMLARGAGGAPVDFMAEFAFPLPSNVVGELLGVPEEDRSWFRQRVLDFGAILELGGRTEENLRLADTAAGELMAYFADLVAKRRVEPQDDLVSAMVAAEGAELLNETELLANLITVFNAGFVTTTHLFGNGLVLLQQRPELLAQLRDDPGLAAGYVEEILRFEPPVHFVVRWAAREAEIEGVRIPADAMMLVLLGAANRDPVRYPDPDVFDPTRVDSQPASFGAGAHFCLGAALSRIEGQLVFPHLLRRLPGLALAAPPGDRRALMLLGYDTLPVTLG